MGFLDGVRVVDATRLLPGGFCTMILSDMGAEVIKVEQPGLGDYMRATPPTKDGRSPVHATVNRNKKSIGIDLKSAEGKAVMRRLLRTADVFVEGFRPGAMTRLGLSFPQVKRVSPKIVYCSISTYGQDIRLSSMPGHDINFQAMAGTLAYSTRAEVPLLQLGDLASGMYAALGILGALAGRRRPVFVDVPIVGSLISWMVLPASVYLATGRAPTEGNSLIFGSTPYYNLYRTSDGRYMAVAAIEPAFWRNLVASLGVPELEQMRFGTEEERGRVASELGRIFATRTRDEWAKLLMDRDTCATPVLTVEEALASDWAKSLGMLAGTGRDDVLNGPVRTVPAMRTKPFTAAPDLGGDTDSIMKSLGYSRAVTQRLKSKGAVQ
ncbi:MAG: CoA transferase [Nitrososphaerota archaeon]|nr:CoA transferase [Nitrososphaerota archaeon]MDG6959183.1 CoA transferase [Nitrososphaerota archaeon]MDG6968778.1 CoA transferase [Nitrososphaerota archaeon]MDG6973686.1 CoA transferase [Nitrososphaerota archaeon]MDG6976640.1 CoA transferase [Nitrososphaerota archaeon]